MNSNSAQSALIDAIAKFSDQQGILADQNSILKRIKDAGFPSSKSEEYRFTPITRTLEKHFAGTGISKPGNFSFDVKEPLLTDAIHVAVHNGVIAVPERLPDGLKIYTTTASETESSDVFESVVQLLCKEILVIEASQKIEQPILIDHRLATEKNPEWINLSIQVKVQQNCSLTVAEQWSYSGEPAVFYNQSLHGQAGKESQFNYFRFQDASGNLNQVYNSEIIQQGKSQVNAFTLTTNGGIIRNNFSVVIDGENAEANLLGLYLISGKTLADNHTVVDHRKPNSNSNELFKGVISGDAKAVFNGKIFVRPDAQKTNAFQSNRNIILTENASVNTKPQLEIWADDVKCSHGCTTGQLDEDAVFYLQARGIDKHAAQALLLDAFAGEVADKITVPAIRAIARALATKKIESLK
jgi:Fe-S cluster assembly protein SufD